ncbi:ferritin [Variovorax paradoxus]|jgi:rubrerythrin|uniref:ferritin-like domain-containing protein n=1 Tax=Variovorax TaxID=34072 RepID=UPI0006E6476F|nr:MULTISPECIES: ferritin-like domain-containing protein [unclassified Variovorax]KPU92115.1 ferritin [Variovorax paradoxus]KPU98268.1 ferritin [Variovorax paradoxus]KPV00883.1 ferritin [Variovorax paradoxus]KPV16502.1 ferritin [Variovorax paradoxus]KPV26118.1 ferritin [Variovorax paradoxus]
MASHEAEAHWTIEDLDFSRIALDRVRSDENLFYLVAAASFIESGSDLYTHNLVDFFRGDEEVTAWLSTQWEQEELQHGKALRAYVEYVWPEFPWEQAYRGFLEEYATYCKVELLAPTRGLEMSARCVVETGTATYYKAMARSTDEPVLHDLATRIATDEVNHYKHFYRFFRRYREQEGLGRFRVLGTIGRRTLELKSEDADCAIRHVVRARSPERADDAAYVRGLGATMNRTIRTHLSPGATLKMLMRPLELPARVQTVVQYPIQQFMQHVFLR